MNAKRLDSVAGGLEGRGKMRRGVLIMAHEREARKQGEERVERESRAFRTGTSDELRFRAASGVETAKFGRDKVP